MNAEPTTPTTDKEGSLRSPGPETPHVVPPVDIHETENSYVLRADMPGVRPEGLDIHVERERLTLRGRVTPERESRAQYQEFALRDYYRVFTLAGEIDSDKISAALKDGVLRLELPKSARAQVRRIQVSGG